MTSTTNTLQASREYTSRGPGKVVSLPQDHRGAQFQATFCSTLRLYYVTTCPPPPPLPCALDSVGLAREGGREKEERSHSLGAELWLEKKLKNTDRVLKVKLNTLFVYIHYVDSRSALPIANVHGPQHGLGHGH